MNLEGQLDERLWHSLQSSYQDRNFTGAILDAIYFLSDLIREKTGLEGDGVALVGQAFGGKNPKLRVNRLQTESERNIQAGVEQLLRGIFQAVRNPRSHEKHADEQKDADAIIVFINFLLGIIDQSKAPFTKSEFLNRVFDPGFVASERYASLLVDEIPAKHRLDVMLSVYQRKETGDGKKLQFFMTDLFDKLRAPDKTEFCKAVSDELKTTAEDKTIRYILQILPAETMEKYDEAARMRMENKLIESVSSGRYDPKLKSCSSGALGTWASGRCQHFLLQKELSNTLVQKIISADAEEHEYVFCFFWDDLTELINPPSRTLISAITKKLMAGDKSFHEQICGERALGNSEWVKPFETAIASFKETQPTPPKEPDDELPF